MSKPLKVPTYSVPERSILMMNGERWKFRFDNAALHHMDQHYGGAAGIMEMYHSMTATQQRQDGEQVSFDKFLYELMPPLTEPEVKIPLDELMVEVKAKQDAIKAKQPSGRPGNAQTPIQMPSEPAGPGATITAE